MRQFVSFTILTIAIFTSLTSTAQARVIDIKKILQEAKAIRKIIVIGYQDSIMLYRYEKSTDTLKIDCGAKKYSEPFRLTLIKNKTMRKTDLAGKWPSVGQKVLIVINAINKISLFARKTGDDYRFWDPNIVQHSNSMFSIIKERPYKPLADCDNSKQNESNYWLCNDGCLAIAFDIKERE